MIHSVLKHGTSFLLLTFVVLTSVLRFHHHDCHGHMSFAFSENTECLSPHIHLYASTDSGEDSHHPHNHNHFCPISVEFQATGILKACFINAIVATLAAILPSYRFEFSAPDVVISVLCDFLPHAALKASLPSFNLRAPPFML